MTYEQPVIGSVLCGFACHVNASPPRTGGNDYPVPIGTPVHAIAGGIVTQAMNNSVTAGVYVEINHGGLHSRYLHLSQRSVSVGDAVMVRQVIGLSGNTGNTTGPHLHFDVGTAPDTASRIDPETLFKEDDMFEETDRQRAARIEAHLLKIRGPEDNMIMAQHFNAQAAALELAAKSLREAAAAQVAAAPKPPTI